MNPPLEKGSPSLSPNLPDPNLSSPSSKDSPQFPRKKISSVHVSSPTQLVHDLKRLNESTKMNLGDLTESCYAHFREEGVAMKETQDQSPRTKHVQKMLRRSIRLINPINQTITLTEPIEATVGIKRQSDDCVDVSEIKLFQEYLNQRTAILENHQRSSEQLDQQPIVRLSLNPVNLSDQPNLTEESTSTEPKAIPLVKRRSSKTIRPISIQLDQSVEPSN